MKIGHSLLIFLIGTIIMMALMIEIFMLKNTGNNVSLIIVSCMCAIMLIIYLYFNIQLKNGELKNNKPRNMSKHEVIIFFSGILVFLIAGCTTFVTAILYFISIK